MISQPIEITSDLSADVVDSMGSDLTVINAARVSFNQKSDEMTERDRGLINFLMKNKHTSPFEHCQVSFLVTAPIFVAREWHRHRTQCLAPNTPITCIQPNGTPYQRTIAELYRTHHGVEAPERWVSNGKNRQGNPARTLIPGTDRYRALNRNSTRSLRVFDEENREFTTGIIGEIWQSGEKELFEVRTTASHLKGQRDLIVVASADHPFLTTEGWVKVKDLTGDELIIRPGKISTNPLGQQYPPSLRQGIGVWTSMMRPKIIGEGARCYVCNDYFSVDKLQLDHLIPVSVDLSLALTISNLAPACVPCHRDKTDTEQGSRKGQTKLGELNIRLRNKPIRVGEGMTYDLSMEGLHHNYLADHLVVHNSYNEVSGRYTELLPKFYAPQQERPLIQVGKPGAYNFVPSEDPNLHVQLLADMRFSCQTAWDTYQISLNRGVAKEVARMVLPVNIYTGYYATANLLNWCKFIGLRADDQALYEIRMLAYQVRDKLKELYPVTMETWEKNYGGSL